MTEHEISTRFPLFEKELVQKILEVADVRTFAGGEQLIRTGQNIRSAMLVLDGMVKIYREDDDGGGEFFMYYLNAGKACAVTLACGPGRETSGLTGKAVLESTIISIPVKYVDEWMGKYKSWAQFSVATYRERFDELLQTIDHIAFQHMDERLMFYLKRHSQKFGSNVFTLSFTEIAQDLNSSREVISRLMKKLSEKGAVKLYRSHFELLDIHKALL